MKIVSHNINGLNAYIKNGKLNKILEEEADIYCFQEVKCSTEKKIKDLLGKDIIDNYYVYNSINEFKKGYAGVTVLIKKNLVPLNIDKININNVNISGYSQGRLIICEFDKFILLNLYSINSAGETKTHDRLLYEMYINQYVKQLQKIKPVIICGDFNVCGTKYDYWGNYDKAINSQPGLMKFEINLFKTLLSQNNLIDGYRTKHGNNRKYSWLPTRTKKKIDDELKGWRLDYFLLSQSLKDNIEDCEILEQWQDKDHSPITINLTI